jgi:sugar-specific transcriptional regulator TrmB
MNKRGGRRGDLSNIDARVAEGLTHLGLTAYEIRVYHAILNHPHSRVPEIARESRVPQPKVYATIKRLIELGLCQSHLGAINQYSALEPSDGFAHLLEESRRRQREAASAIDQLQQSYSEAGQGMARREGRVKLFQGKPAAGRDFRELVGRAENEIDIVVRFPLVVGDYMELAHGMLKKGGRMRMLCELPRKLDDEQGEFIEQSRAAGATLRRVTHVPMRMGIFDRQILVLPMSDPNPERGEGFTMLEVRNPGLCESFVEIFELLWERARPL